MPMRQSPVNRTVVLALIAGILVLFGFLATRKSHIRGPESSPLSGQPVSTVPSDPPLGNEALVEQAAPEVGRRSVSGPEPEGVGPGGQGGDSLERVVMVLVIRGRLTVDAASYPAIQWSDVRFALHPVSPYAVWVDLRTTTTVGESGEFELRAECRRMPESRGDDDEYVMRTIRSWTHVGVSAGHPLLLEQRVDVPLEPWPEALVAGPDETREVDAGVIALRLASGVMGQVADPNGLPAAGAVVALYVLDEANDLVTSVEYTSAVADKDGRFFLHHAAGDRVLIVATSRGLVPVGRLVELVEDSVADLGLLELERGQRIAGRVELPENGREMKDIVVLVDGFEPWLRNSREVTYQSLHMLRTVEADLPWPSESFYWDGSSVFRLRCRTGVGADGSFEIGGLSERCHRVRVTAPSRSRHLQLNHRMISERGDIWSTECAPTEYVRLRAATSTIHFRIVRPAADDPLLPQMGTSLGGTLAWTDAQGSVLSTWDPTLDDVSFETLPLQSVELRVDGDPTGRVHRLTSPAAGEAKSYDIEVPRLAREGG